MLLDRNVAILDIGSDKIFVYIGNVNSDKNFIIKSSAEVTYDGFQNGEWLNEECVKDSILNCLNKALYSLNIKLSCIYIGVPGDFSKVQIAEEKLNFGSGHKVNANDINELFEKTSVSEDGFFEVINCSPVNYLIDGREKTLDPRGALCYSLGLKASYVLCKKSYSELFRTILSSYCKKIKFISVPWAESIYLIDAEKRDKNSAVLCNVGYLTTEVSYISGDGLLALDSFALGGGHIAYDLSYGLKIPYDTACFVKSKIDFNVSNGEEAQSIEIGTMNGIQKVELEYINMIASARLEEIAEKIKNIVQNYKIEYPKYLEINLTGRGISDMKGVRKVMPEFLGRACNMINLSYSNENKTATMQTTATCLMKVVSEYDKPEGFWAKLFKSWRNYERVWI